MHPIPAVLSFLLSHDALQEAQQQEQTARFNNTPILFDSPPPTPPRHAPLDFSSPEIRRGSRKSHCNRNARLVRMSKKALPGSRQQQSPPPVAEGFVDRYRDLCAAKNNTFEHASTTTPVPPCRTASAEVNALLSTICCSKRPVDAFIVLQDSSSPHYHTTNLHSSYVPSLLQHLNDAWQVRKKEQQQQFNQSGCFGPCDAGDAPTVVAHALPRMIHCSLKNIPWKRLLLDDDDIDAFMLPRCIAKRLAETLRALRTYNGDSYNNNNNSGLPRHHVASEEPAARTVWFFTGVTTACQLDAVKDGLALWLTSQSPLVQQSSVHPMTTTITATMPSRSDSMLRFGCIPMWLTACHGDVASNSNSVIIQNGYGGTDTITSVKQQISESMKSLWCGSSVALDSSFPITFGLSWLKRN